MSSECAWPWAELSLPTLVGNLVSNKKQDCETVKTDTEKTCGIKNIKKLFKYVTAIAKGSMRIPPPPPLTPKTGASSVMSFVTQCLVDPLGLLPQHRPTLTHPYNGTKKNRVRTRLSRGGPANAAARFFSEGPGFHPFHMLQSRCHKHKPFQVN